MKLYVAVFSYDYEGIGGFEIFTSEDLADTQIKSWATNGIGDRRYIEIREIDTPDHLHWELR